MADIELKTVLASLQLDDAISDSGEDGGSMEIVGGIGDVVQGGDGGRLLLAGGIGGDAGGKGGSVQLSGGVGGSSTGNGGTIEMESGSAPTEGDGGDIELKLGWGAGAGRNGMIILSNLPTADPVIAGAVWSDGGTLKISAG